MCGIALVAAHDPDTSRCVLQCKLMLGDIGLRVGRSCAVLWTPARGTQRRRQQPASAAGPMH